MRVRSTIEVVFGKKCQYCEEAACIMHECLDIKYTCGDRKCMSRAIFTLEKEGNDVRSSSIE